MEDDPVTAASHAEIKYGMRGKVAFNSLGTAPVDVLMENGAMTIEQVREELEEEREPETVQLPGIEKYFEILEDYGFVEYTEEGKLFTAWNSTVQKNGVPHTELREFVEEYRDN
jgi:hypothetical protein